MALIILEKDRGRGPLAIILVRGLFFLGFLGLSMSKETNIAVMSWILAFYLYHCPVSLEEGLVGCNRWDPSISDIRPHVL